MKALIGRLAKHSPAIHHVRRDILLALRPRGLAEPFSAFCRTYGLVDEKNTIRGSEGFRLCIFTALFRGAQNRVAVTVDAAVRANKPMLVGAMAKRMQGLFRTTARKDPTIRSSNEYRGVVRVVMDDYLYEALQRYEMSYRKPNGLVDDVRLISDLLRAGLSDPDLDAIGRVYRRRMEPLRIAVRQIEAYATPLLLRALGEEIPLERLSRAG